MSAALIRESLAAITAQLAEKKVVTDPARVLVIARDQSQVPFIDSEMDILLRVRSLTVDDAQYIGAGREFCRNDRIIDVIPRTRDARDDVATDLAWLTDETLGHLALEDQIYDALEEFSPVRAADGMDLLIVPLHLLRTSDPVRGTRASNAAWTWGHSVMSFMASYQQMLTVPPA
jgi:hypothetical protein